MTFLSEARSRALARRLSRWHLRKIELPSTVGTHPVTWLFERALFQLGHERIHGQPGYAMGTLSCLFKIDETQWLELHRFSSGDDCWTFTSPVARTSGGHFPEEHVVKHLETILGMAPWESLLAARELQETMEEVFLAKLGPGKLL